jgi:hypothetical protein
MSVAAHSEAFGGTATVERESCWSKITHLVQKAREQKTPRLSLIGARRE